MRSSRKHFSRGFNFFHLRQTLVSILICNDTALEKRFEPVITLVLGNNYLQNRVWIRKEKSLSQQLQPNNEIENTTLQYFIVIYVARAHRSFFYFFVCLRFVFVFLIEEGHFVNEYMLFKIFNKIKVFLRIYVF